MNILKVVGLVAGVGSVIVSCIMYDQMYNKFNKDVDCALDHKVYEKFGRKANEARQALSIAQAEADKIYRQEIELTKTNLLTNEEYNKAVSIVDANNSQIEVLKKALRDAKNGSGTNVSVGTPGSTVSVNVKDTATINKLQADISTMQKELKINKNISTSIWKTERNKVAALRTAEQNDVISKVTDAERQYNKVKFDQELYKNDLSNDEYFMEAAREEAFINNYKPVNVIFASLLYTIPCVVCVALVWKRAIFLLSMRNKILKGV